MNTIPRTKHGSCCQCPATNTSVIKVGKITYCISCHRKNKGQQQLTKSKERDKQRYEASKNQTHKPTPSLTSSVRGLVDKNIGKDKVIGSKSELLREADRLFSLWIRNRDSDKDGNIICPCCNKKYNVAQLDNEGNKLVQCLHFVNRNVYSLRHDPDNAKSGCGYCNLAMHLQPKGKEYLNYKEVLIKEFGEAAVLEMELAHRKINRIDATQLKNAIEHYSN